ncbi:hypothetical protein NW845_00545 [Synechococcus sp. H60.2]|uniref:hypothetical protein n=1 Tax=Synechococcus sp. H60.2 TaxID=2964518 RepID=UPI0039C4B470
MNPLTSPSPAAIEREKFEIRLGEALNKAGLLTPAQLAQAMWEKADSPLMLGELCMQHGWVAPQDLYPLIPVELVRIGEILVLHGYLEVEHVYQALLQQKHHPERKLGEILVQQGWVQPHWLEWALDKQQQLRRRRGAANSWEVMVEQWSTIPDQPPLYASPLQAAQQVHKATAQYKAQLERYQEQVAALKAQLEQERQHQQATAEQLRQQIANYQAQQQRMAELEAQLAAQIQQGSEQHRAAQQRIQELEEQLQAQQDRGSAQVQALAKQLQASQAELETLRRRCHELTEWQSQAKPKLQELGSRLQQHQQTEAHLRQTLEQKEAQLATLSQSLQEHQHQLQLAQSTKTRLIADLAHARQEAAETIHRLQMQLQETQARLQETQAQLQQAQEQVRQLQAQLQAVQTQPAPPPATVPTAQQQVPPQAISTPTVAARAAEGELPPQGYLGEEDLEALQRATPWVQRILTQLRAAGLLDNAGIEAVIHAWETEGGTFTDVLTHHSGLKPETVKFFSEDGYSVYLAGGRHVADYLKASGLVSAVQIEQIQKHLPPGGSLCQALVEAGLLSQATALYFERHFGGKKPRRSLREELML